MKLKNMRTTNNWKEVYHSALVTVGKDKIREPSSDWKRSILLAEHSPIRLLSVSWEWHDLPYWVSVHLVRHKIGIEHFVRSQRTDRTGVDRGELPQGAPVVHAVAANAQALINISRKRLCKNASKETREAWQLVVDALWELEPELADRCVRECVYRGACTEIKGCGFDKKERFDFERRGYLRK
jgi:thymidylate synthase ThyX